MKFCTSATATWTTSRARRRQVCGSCGSTAMVGHATPMCHRLILRYLISTGCSLFSSMEGLHDPSIDQLPKEVRAIRRAVETEGRRGDERLPVQGREAAGRLRLARPQGDR